MPNKAELLKLRDSRAYWKRYARLFPQHRIDIMDGRTSCTLVPLDRRAGLRDVILSAEVVAAIDAAHNEGRAYAAAQKD